MKFDKGSELDKQIYKEGESTWGCKSGVLDVEDVYDFIQQVKENLCANPKCIRYPCPEDCMICSTINELAGAYFHGKEAI